MISMFFHMTIKPGREQEWTALARRVVTGTRAEPGCIGFTMYRRKDDLRKVVLVEQWRDAEALNAHFARLQAEFGPPNAGGRIPKAIMEFIEAATLEHYEPLEPGEEA